MIVQSDKFSTENSVTLCPITSDHQEAPLLRIELSPSETLPLARTSWIAVDKITTIRRAGIDRIIGNISPTGVVKLNASLVVFLGIG